MKHFTMMIQSILVLVFGMTQVSFLYAEALGSQQAEGVSHAPDTLVMVEKVIAFDADGEAHTLYQEEEGRIYRLDNVNQVVHDLNARGIKSKGNFHSLQAVLAERVFVMGKNNQPYPTERSEVGIPETYRLAVENLRVTKDRVTAIYTTNCNGLSI